MSNIISYLLTARNQTGPAFDQVRAGMQGVQNGAQSMGNQLTNLRGRFDNVTAGAGGFKTMLGSLAGLATGGFLVGMVKGTVTVNSEIARLSQFLNISVESLSSLKYAFGSVGVKAESFAEILKDISKKQREALQGNNEFLFYFKQLGITVDDLKTKDVTQLISKMADGWNELADGPKKASLAIKMFEGNAQNMQQVLKAGAAGLQNMKEEAAKLGLVLSDKAAKDAIAFEQSLFKLKASAGPLAQEITASLIPSIEAVSKAMKDARADGQGWLESMATTVTKGYLGFDGSKERANELQKVNAQRKSGYLDDTGSPSFLSGWNNDNTAAVAVKYAAKAAGMKFDDYLAQELQKALDAVKSKNPAPQAPELSTIPRAPTGMPTSLPPMDSRGYPAVSGGGMPAGLPPLVDANGKPVSMATLPYTGGGIPPPIPGKGFMPPPGKAPVGALPALGAPPALPALPAAPGTREAELFDATDTAAAARANAQAASDAENKVWVASYSLRKGQLKSMLDGQEISYKAYYDNVAALEQAELQDSMNANEMALAEQQKLKAEAATKGEQYAAEAAINNLMAERKVLLMKVAESEKAATDGLDGANKTLAKQMADIAAAAAEMDQNFRTSAALKLEAQYGEIERLAQINGLNTDQITKIKEITMATAELQDARKELGAVQARAGNAELAIQGLVLKGIISQATAEERLEKIRKGAAADQLGKARKVLDAARKTGSAQEVSAAEQTVGELDNTVNAVSQKTRDFWDGFEQQATDGGAAILRAFQSAEKHDWSTFRDVTKGVFRDISQGIAEDAASNVSKTLAKALRETMMNAMGSGGGDSGGGIFGTIIKGIASYFGGGARAAGGTTTGWTLVGEHGPELANFGQTGGTVLNAARTTAVLNQGNGGAGGPVNVHFHGIKDGVEIKRSMSQIQAQLAGAVSSGQRNR